MPAYEIAIGLNFGEWYEILATLKMAWQDGAETTLYTREFFTFSERDDYEQQAKYG